MAEQPSIVKCLVWDLDNTLWQGTLLEDGEVRLPESVRELITELDSRGILQSVASKNDHDQAWKQLEALGVAEYFVLPRIGWGPKSDSVREIADELDFALGTIAFVDDQPAERAEVRFHLPEVRCYDAGRLPELAALPEFSPATVTVDSRRRRQMYQAGFRRKSAEAEFQGPSDDFLRSLELEMRVGRATEDELSRVEELTLRTSQMNATGVHYSISDLRALLADPRHEVLVTTLTDRFGPHGAVGLQLLEKHVGVWNLKLLATSCRVVSFGAGSVLLGWLVDQAAHAGVHLVADFRRTERNRMMEIAYRLAGFTGEPCDCRAGLPAPAQEDVQRLHLLPAPCAPPPTMKLHTVSLQDA
ncbi:HAD-IIIC family phosphatase [Streptomyces olivoreticuli]|uniref:HAD-IIIC family phosphatase n=1 Tax=Streptomyces olivoreticuli TaxID=68246 RepID=UPI00265A7EA2|nr:HAD-IIIC family phosphatase [Streptomyces olivoreticuli]WKK23573.1 HAD-IIIC family phosphatase [Streptomyces olivoreticuli]